VCIRSGSGFLFVLICLCGCRPLPPTPLPETERGAHGSPSAVVSGLPPSPVTFADVTEQSGIRFVLGHGGRSPLTIRDTIGTGAAFLDYDGDGWQDLFLVGQEGTASKGVCALYRNEAGPATNDQRPTRRFVDVTAGSGLTRPGFWLGCATGDWDNDGRVDLLVTGDGCVALYRNEGGGRFRDVATQVGIGARGWATSAAFADVDRDGRLDLYVGRYVRFGKGAPDLCTYRGVQAACPPTHYDPQFGSLYLQRDHRPPTTDHRPPTRFVDVTGTAGLGDSHGKTLGVAFADYDDDGRVDLYLANDGVPGDMYHQTPAQRPASGTTPTFRNVGLEVGTGYNAMGGEQAGMGTDFGDYDGDGRLDLVVTTFQREPKSLYRNEGGGQFTERGYAAGIGAATVNMLGFGTRLADFDNDGHVDLVIANGHVQNTIARIQPGIDYPQRTQLFMNRGDGTFQEVNAGPAFTRPIVGRGLATADWDNDGDLDLVVTDLEGRPLLLRNEGAGETRHWLQVALAGVRSNRMGIGARLTLTGGGRTWVREVTTGGSYLSAGDARAHFGLGTVSRLDRLTIRWPSGITQPIASPPVDRLLTVREAAGRGAD
jgi:hypothetical protein